MQNPTQPEYPIKHIALEAEVHSYTALAHTLHAFHALQRKAPAELKTLIPSAEKTTVTHLNAALKALSTAHENLRIALEHILQEVPHV